MAEAQARIARLSIPIAGPADAARLFAPLVTERRERLSMACLDDDDHLLSLSTGMAGAAGMTTLPVAGLLRQAMGAGAASLIVAHNHPGGDPAPSLQDVRATRGLALGAQAIGLVLLDHIVVASGGWASFRLLGLL